MKLKSQFKPILFSTDMVKAILSGKKTQTRRILRLKHLPNNEIGSIHKDGSGKGWIAWSPRPVSAEETAKIYPGNDGFKPKWQVGDILWVRETWHYSIHKTSPYLRHSYKATPDDGDNSLVWKPSIFMPKFACRLFLEVTNIRAERLQDITEEDAIAEGIDTCFKKGSQYYEPNDYKNYTWHGEGGNDSFSGYSNTKNAKESFQSLWYKINGAESWGANPFVWVITFKGVERPKNF